MNEKREWWSTRWVIVSTIVASSLPVLLAASLSPADARAVSQARAANPGSLLLDPDHAEWSRQAPDRFRALLETSKGDVTIEVQRAQAPIGADRFYNLIRLGFYDDSRFYRLRERFIAQFGLPGNPAVTAAWRGRALRDDPVAATNARGSFSYAMTGPDTRTTQIYFNLVDNPELDEQGFAPLGRVIEGMDVLDSLHAGYGESAGGGMRLGKQARMIAGGNAHLDASFPLLDRILRIRLVAPE